MDCRRLLEIDVSPSATQAVLDMIEGAGMEIAPDGSSAALAALTVRCPACYGQGYHQDDSHPGNQAATCERCGGHCVIPRTTPRDQSAQEPRTSAAEVVVNTLRPTPRKTPERA